MGRAGRGDRPGRAIIQTYMPDHPVISAVAERPAMDFYDAELESRRLLRLAAVRPPHQADRGARGPRRGRGKGRARWPPRCVRERQDGGCDVEVLGPAPAYIARRAGKWRFHVVLRGDDPLDVLGGDPGVPWSVDVDPESLL